MAISLESEIQKIDTWDGLPVSGVVTQIIGLLIESIGPFVRLGEVCYIYNRQGESIPCEVVGFKENRVLLMSMGDLTHISPGAEVLPTRQIHRIPVSDALLGRVIDAMGNPIDGLGPIPLSGYYPVMQPPPSAMQRPMITKVLPTGIKAIDATCTTGVGQRVGIFSGAGLGKSTLLSMIARSSTADVNVIALIGERGREVREFIERDLKEALARSVVIVVTSDQAALLRARGAHAATAIAEYFRDRGKQVVFMMDSITRFAMALREVGLAVGEPPTTRGYTPSVFASLPKLLERTGNAPHGSITAFYTVLVEGDDLNEPVADSVRSLLDGHIVLSRKLASANYYPAVDVLQSLSRVMVHISSPEEYARASRLRDILQIYKEAEDLINIGAYVTGSNPAIDQAISLIGRTRKFLMQGLYESVSFENTQKQLKALLNGHY